MDEMGGLEILIPLLGEGVDDKLSWHKREMVKKGETESQCIGNGRGTCEHDYLYQKKPEKRDMEWGIE